MTLTRDLSIAVTLPAMFVMMVCLPHVARAAAASPPKPQVAGVEPQEPASLESPDSKAPARLATDQAPSTPDASVTEPGDDVRERSGLHAEDIERIELLGLHPEFNRLQFYDRSAVERFAKRWRHGARQGLSIVHLGDSHVQGGAIHVAMRRQLEPTMGAGGPGLLFPYSIAKTYAPRSYSSKHTGRWKTAMSRRLPADMPLGVTGMSARTAWARSSFTIRFKETPPPHWRKLRVYCQRDKRSYDLKIDSGGKTTVVRVRPRGDDALPYVEVTLPKIGTEIRVRMSKRAPRQRRFELHGMTLSSVNPGGLVVHNGGVGASRYRAILHEELLVSHLQTLAPDLVLVEYGTNDYLYDDEIKPELEGQIRTAIARIRTAAPHATIALVSVQDIFRRGHHLSSGVAFSDLLHRIARAEGVAVYDWFWVAGGAHTIEGWHERGLAKKDMIHLTSDGYAFKGRLLAEALERTVRWTETHPQMSSLVVDRTSHKAALSALEPEPEPEDLTLGPVEATAEDMEILVYTVRRGEAVAGIARRHGVTVEQIRQWNGMMRLRIHPGRKLVLRVPKK